MVFFKSVLNKKQILVSVLVVMSLFLTVLSQTLNASISCDSENDCTIVYSQNSTPAEPGHHEETTCDDPCHLGFSHLGHCGLILQTSSFNIEDLSSQKEISYFNLFIKDPLIKGLRRPPRAA